MFCLRTQCGCTCKGLNSRHSGPKSDALTNEPPRQSHKNMVIITGYQARNLSYYSSHYIAKTFKKLKPAVSHIFLEKFSVYEPTPSCVYFYLCNLFHNISKVIAFLQLRHFILRWTSKCHVNILLWEFVSCILTKSWNYGMYAP